MSKSKTYPKLHNATWPGVVGKGGDGEPVIDLATMLDFTSRAEAAGERFDGFDLFLCAPHFDIEGDINAEAKKLAEICHQRKLVVGSIVAPVWDGTGGGSAMGDEATRNRFLTQVRKGCEAGQKLREAGVRPTGCVRIDTATSVDAWASDPERNQKKIIETFREAARIARDHGEKLAMEGEVCWGGIHSCRRAVQILEGVDAPDALGFQADLAHTYLYLLGVNAPEDRILPANADPHDVSIFDEAYRCMTDQLRPWTIDLHIAQNDGSVHGTGDHDKTGRHCLVTDPNGKLDIVKCAGFWLNENGRPTRKIEHICWDGCMFPNAVMKNQKTWNDILGAMVQVRDAWGWE